MVDLATVNAFLDLFAFLILVTVLSGCYFDRKNIKSNSKPYFEGMIGVTMLRTFTDAASWFLEGRPEYSVLNYIVTTILLLSGYMVALFFTHFLHENLFGNKTRRILGIFDIVCLAFCISLVAFSVTGDVFSIVDGHYIRGRFYDLIYVFPGITALVNLGIVIFKKDIGARERIALLLYMIIAWSGDILQLAFYGLSIGNLANTIVINIIYVDIYLQKSKKQQQEMNDNRVSMMLSQIQPHFMFNTITTIQELCLIEPETASKALNKFGKFLRCNMDSLSSPEIIPFHKELEHVGNYVYLQKLRFGDRLNVEFQIGTEDFSLPPLSIQPIVENSIRHGICKKIKGGTIRLITGESPNGYEIVISDDGVGFDTSTIVRDGTLAKEHVGLSNIISRIENQCGGTMEIKSEKDVGTTVKIIIPKH